MHFIPKLLNTATCKVLTSVALLMPFLATESLAAVTVTKTFTPSTVEVGQQVAVLYTFFNDDSNPETNIAFTEDFSGIAANAGFTMNSDSCGFSNTPAVNAPIIAVTNGSMVGGTCVFGGNLFIPANTTPDMYTLTTTGITSTDGIAGPAATPNVMANLIINPMAVPAAVTAVPTLNPVHLLMLAMLMLGAGWGTARRLKKT